MTSSDTSRPSPRSSSWRWGVGVLLVWEILLLTTAVTWTAVSKHESFDTATRVISFHNADAIWQRWDASIYERLAIEGYTFFGQQGNYGFWPLWPLVLRLATLATQSVVVTAAMLVPCLTFLSGCVLYRLIRLDEDRRIARRTLLWLAVWPTSFFLLLPFSEALFLCLAVTALYLARTQRWALAGLAAAGLALTRHVGVLILIPLVVEWWTQRRLPLRPWFRSPLWLSFGVVGACVFPFYVFLHRGVLLAALNYQRYGFSHAMSNPVTELWRYIQAAWQDPAAAAQLALFCAGAAAVWLIIRLARQHRLRPSYAWYTVVLFLFPLFSANNLLGIPRYTIVLFPIALALAKVIRRPWLVTLIMGISFITQLILFGLYTQGAMITL